NGSRSKKGWQGDVGKIARGRLLSILPLAIYGICRNEVKY
ncbi:unnamed protein product, partial [marine sediment metagenome]